MTRTSTERETGHRPPLERAGKPVVKPASGSARAAAIAAVAAAASLVSGQAGANAAANMNLGYEFIDELRAVDTVEHEPWEAEAPDAVAPALRSSRPIPEGPASSNSRMRARGSAPSALPAASAEQRIEVDKRLAEAERLYQSGHFDEALPAFRAVADADAGQAHAWLRIGNLLHRKRDWFDALTAYRRAARPQAAPAIREKAMYNVALLNLELARQALKRLERIRAESTGQGSGGAEREPGVSDHTVRQLSEQLGLSYDALAAAGASAAPPPGLETTKPALADTPVLPGKAVEAEKQLQAVKHFQLEKPVRVEIRQGGGAR